MELEYKFYLPEDVLIEEILDNPVWQSLNADSWSKHHFVAKYYDSKDLGLSKALIALRVRDEDKNYVLTLKTPSASNQALSLRNEWNFEWTNSKPSIEFIKKNLAPELTPAQYDTLSSLSDDDLVCNMSTAVYRYIKRIEIGNSSIEVALDKGFLSGGNNKDDVYELELELLQGEKEDLDKLAEILNQTFTMQPGVKSKMERCVELLNQN